MPIVHRTLPLRADRRTRHPFASALVACAGGLLLASYSDSVSAQSVRAAESVFDIDLPAQPLAQALAALSRQTGVQLFAPGELVSGLRAPAVQGRLSASQAMDRLLAGSGLAGRAEGASLVIRKAPTANPAEGGVVLPPMTVRAAPEPLAGELPPAYAGGQVARGARVGVLGNGDFLETPFNTIGFTDEFKQNIQARNLADVLQYSVSAQTPQSGAAPINDVITLRGFTTSTGVATIDGLNGLAARMPPVDPFERVEVLLGADSFANGGANGYVGLGGSINLVPKRAGDLPLARLGVHFESDSIFGTSIDAGRRFGADGAWGVRVNGNYADGDTELENVSRGRRSGSLALDYRGEKIRASLDVIQSRRVQNFGTGVDYGALLPDFLQDPPDAHAVYSVRGSLYDQDYRLAIGKVEWDLAEHWTAALAYGEAHEDELWRFAGYTLADAGGLLTNGSAGEYTEGLKAKSAALTLQGRFVTGGVTHRLSAGLSKYTNKSRSDYPTTAALPDANLYLRNDIVIPAVPAAVLPPNSQYDQATTGIFVSDQIGLLDESLQIILGARRVGVEQQPRDGLTGATAGKAYEARAVTPAVGLLYRFTPRWSAYVNRVEGLGASSIVSTNDAGRPYANAGQVLPPTRSKQTEAGFKADFGAYAVTFALFRIGKVNEYGDVATNTFVQNGLQKNTGAELSLFGEPLRGLRIYSGLAFIEAKIERSAGGTLDGTQPGGVPRVNFSASADWDVPGLPGLALTGGLIHTGATRADGLNSLEVRAWTRVDAGLRYRVAVSGKDTVFRFSAQNLFDKNYFMNDRGGANLAAPLTFLASASVDF